MLKTRDNEATVANKASSSRTEIKRVGKFGIVGILNTGIDFVIYNVLSSTVGLNLVQSNIASTTVAMIFSFLVNRHVVFKKQHGSIWRQAAIFFLATAFGLYILQTGTIHLLTETWLWPMNLLLAMAHAIGLDQHDQFLVKNGAKAIATVVSLTWNYIIYKKVVFR